MRLTEFTRLEELQQAREDDLRSHRLDTAIEENQHILEELQKDIESMKNEEMCNSESLRARSRIHLERIITNELDSLQKESNRFKLKVNENIQRTEKLVGYNVKLSACLQKEIEDYMDLADKSNMDMEQLLDLDIEKNSAKYWKLAARKAALEHQLITLDTTIKK